MGSLTIDDYRAIKRVVRLRAPYLIEWEDVVHIACVYRLQTGRTPRNVALDAIRQFVTSESRHRFYIDQPDTIASVYDSDQNLIERWLDEETEDQFSEWRSIAASERDSRISESFSALGTSTPD
jgi:hypothetical protein